MVMLGFDVSFNPTILKIFKTGDGTWTIRRDQIWRVLLNIKRHTFPMSLNLDIALSTKLRLCLSITDIINRMLH